MTNTPPLTPAMLGSFGDALRFAGAPMGSEFLPGLTDPAIDGLGESLGVSIPPELRTLWRWRMPPKSSESPDPWDINPEFELWDPEAIVDMTRKSRVTAGVPADAIAFAGYGLEVLAVSGDDHSGVSPVLELSIADVDYSQVAPSLGALIHLWTEQMLAREYWYDAKVGWQPEDFPMVRIIEPG